MELRERNTGTIVDYEVEEDNNTFVRFFVCPGGMMDYVLKNVRPIISVDAAHMKSIWKGTIYMAVVKTAMDEILPVALSIQRDNECYEGWQYFLQKLHTSCPTLYAPHPYNRCRNWKLFTFISDRLKGLEPALQNVFPENHATSCAVHIKRNVAQNFGSRAADQVTRIAKAYTELQEEKLFKEVQAQSVDAEMYLRAIKSDTWRSTSWWADKTLPPRFGMTTSNISESTNFVLEDGRNGCWLDCLILFMDKTIKKIATLRKKHENVLTGLNPEILQVLEKRWEGCTDYVITQVQNDANNFLIQRADNTLLERNQVQQIWTQQQMCTCGRWQEYAIPCIDAMAYFRFHCKISFTEVLQKHVAKYHTYMAEHEILRYNVNPVILDQLIKDETTLPPRDTKVNATGRPKTKRYRVRNMVPTSDRKPIQCGICHEVGHNTRTCAVRSKPGRTAIDRNNTSNRDIT